MRRIRLSVVLYLLTLCIPYFSSAQVKPDSVRKLVSEQMLVRNIPGLQVAIVKDNKLWFSEAFGVANVEHQIPVTNETLFSINSATKAFTGVAIMQLVEEGKIDVMQPVGRYLDSLPLLWQNIKVKSLLNHTSGIPDFVNVRSGGYIQGLPYVQAFKKTRDLPMEFAEGEKTSYNQTNYVLLGQMIEKISGKRFEEFVKERQFGPAGMTLANFGDSRDIVPNKAPTYAVSRVTEKNFIKGKTLERTWEEFPELRSTAGINCTATELAQWIMALQSGKLLRSPNSLQQMWAAGKLNDGSYGGWALGWVAKRNVAPRAVAGIGGSRSWFYVYPDHGLTVIVLTNMKSNGPENLASEIAGLFYPELKAANGGNLSDALIPLNSLWKSKKYKDLDAAYTYLLARQPGYKLQQRDLVNWAYSVLLLDKRPVEAAPIFRLLLRLYPNSVDGAEGLEAATKGLTNK
ncbi:serine hydrolase domain-containing protein [Pedobacter duraquae]|uniref:CubicO group peptidase (Beta-lactamase class C family) n=1 Tax=Pedobacter duraquae TaxID=425511 RepID=A0A4R6IF40_9SPHI|nr:serine hydrolase domain-containing protein [Pedobacter duraquae]TDO20940.1 CubicO group peptidase (beta-lactamase class C family) [Pedobacter duraquae]